MFLVFCLPLLEKIKKKHSYGRSIDFYTSFPPLSFPSFDFIFFYNRAYDSKHPFYAPILKSKTLFTETYDTHYFDESTTNILPSSFSSIKSSSIQIQDKGTLRIQRQCVHMEIALKDLSKENYQTGDHIGIWPSNDEIEVKTKIINIFLMIFIGYSLLVEYCFRKNQILFLKKNLYYLFYLGETFIELCGSKSFFRCTHSFNSHLFNIT